MRLPVEDAPVVRREHAQLVVLENHDLIRLAHQGGGVAGQEVLLGAHAEHQGTAQAGADQDVGILRADDGQAVGAFKQRQRRTHRLDKVALVAPGDEVGDDLGVGVAAEDDAVVQQAPPQRGAVLDDAVVNDGDAAVAADVRVGVGVGGRPVRRPARVADPHAAGGGPLPQAGDQVGDAAGPLAHVHLARPGQRRQARAVVAAVLQPAQAFRQHRLRLTTADVTNDAAHPQTPWAPLPRRDPEGGPARRLFGRVVKPVTGDRGREHDAVNLSGRQGAVAAQPFQHGAVLVRPHEHDAHSRQGLGRPGRRRPVRRGSARRRSCGSGSCGAARGRPRSRSRGSGAARGR